MDFLEWLGSRGNGVVIIAIVSACAAVTISVWAVAHAWMRIRQSEHRTRLTAMMLERGLTTEQMDEVMQAGKLTDEAADGESSDPEVRLVQHLTGNHYEADDTQKIVEAARRNGRIDESTLDIIKTLSDNWEDTDAIVKLLRARVERLDRGNSEAPAVTASPAGQAA